MVIRHLNFLHKIDAQKASEGLIASLNIDAQWNFEDPFGWTNDFAGSCRNFSHLIQVGVPNLDIVDRIEDINDLKKNELRQSYVADAIQIENFFSLLKKTC